MLIEKGDLTYKDIGYDRKLSKGFENIATPIYDGDNAGGDLTGLYPRPSVDWANGNTVNDARYALKDDVTGGSFLTVAANDTLSTLKDRADYVCDGTDDHVQIQEALDALPSTGGEVRLLDGTFNIESSIVLDSNQTFRGSGKGTILTTSSNTIIVRAWGGNGTEKNNVVVSDLQIDGNEVSSTALYISYSDYMSVKNIYIHSVPDNSSPISCYKSMRCLIDGCDIRSGYCGVSLDYCDDILIRNNTLEGHSVTGIVWQTTCNRLSVVGNVSNGNTYYGISGGGDGHNISSNVCNGNTRAGIRMGSLTNSVISGNSLNENGDEGIFIVTGNNNSITGNTCVGNRSYNFHLERVASHNTVSGNDFSGSTEAGGVLIETGVGDASNNNIIIGNTVNDNAGVGMYIRGTASSLISNNHIGNNNLDGILLSNGSHNNTVSGNYLFNNSQGTDNNNDGINIQTGNYNFITGNTFLSGGGAKQPKYGIHIESIGAPTGNIVHGNNLFYSGKTGDLLNEGFETKIRNNIGNDGEWLEDDPEVPSESPSLSPSSSVSPSE